MQVQLLLGALCNDSETNDGTDAKNEMETWACPDTNRTDITLFGELAQLARALDLHSRGHGFDSLILHICRSGGKNSSNSNKNY